jgi:hypothetical protein
MHMISSRNNHGQWPSPEPAGIKRRHNESIMSESIMRTHTLQKKIIDSSD